MRQATWLRLEGSPFWHRLFRYYHALPDRVRAPLRWLLLPHWQFAATSVRIAARGRVVAGPFRGMRFCPSALSQRNLIGYILGSQEIELHGLIERLATRSYRTILNIGAGDGYYAVGLALRLAASRVVAFEMLPALRRVIAQAAEANGVGARVQICGQCEVAELENALAEAVEPVLIFMDAEGAEMTLLDPLAIPALDRADIVVESHDCFVPGCTETLVARFAPSHEIEQYQGRPRELADYPAQFLSLFRRLFPGLAVDLMDERRPEPQHWLFLSGKSVGGEVVGELPRPSLEPA